MADCLTGPYREPEENEVSLSRKHVEGNFIYRIVGTDTFVMMMDEYTNGRFFLQQTEDLVHFKKLRRRDYSLDFQPRHGSVLAVGEGNISNAFRGLWEFIGLCSITYKKLSYANPFLPRLPGTFPMRIHSIFARTAFDCEPMRAAGR